MMRLLKLGILVTLLFVLTGVVVPVNAWTVAPVRFEVKGEKGREYTFTFSVLNESQLYEKRFEAVTDDWIIDKDNNFLRAKFNKKVKNEYSATQWVKITPASFIVPPGGTKRVRFTISVPPDLPGAGEFTTGIFVGEKNIEKPPEGEKVIHIKQDTFVGVIVYISIGKDVRQVELKDMKVESLPAEDGHSRVLVKTLYENTGNVHARAKLFLEAKEITSGTKSKVKVPKKIDGGELVVVRDSNLYYPVNIPVSLPHGSSWKFTVKADFGKKHPLLVGTKKYVVPKAALPKTETTDEKGKDTSKPVKKTTTKKTKTKSKSTKKNTVNKSVKSSGTTPKE